MYINLETNEVHNEIARKTDSSATIEGVYLNSYINREQGEHLDICNGTIEIRLVKHTQTKYTFVWRDANKKIDWYGEGWIIKTNQMIVKYWRQDNV